MPAQAPGDVITLAAQTNLVHLGSMAVQFNIAEAKAQLSALVEAALRGEEVILARAGKPVARITPFAPLGQPRRLLAEHGYAAPPIEAFAPTAEDEATVSAPLPAAS